MQFDFQKKPKETKKEEIKKEKIKISTSSLKPEQKKNKVLKVSILIFFYSHFFSSFRIFSDRFQVAIPTLVLDPIRGKSEWKWDRNESGAGMEGNGGGWRGREMN